MVFDQGIISSVKNIVPDTPLKFETEAGSILTLQDIVKVLSPEFTHGSWSCMHPLLFNGDLQTSYAGVGHFENVDTVYYGREILNYPDGGTGTADHLISESQFKSVPFDDTTDSLPPRTRFLTAAELAEVTKPSNKPILVSLHGLSGGSFESYVRCTLSKLDTELFDAVVLNARGCSHSVVSTPQLFCGLWTDDIRYLVNDLKSRSPSRSIYAVGYSLGATILSNYIGQEAEKCPLTAACIMANPWDMMESSFALHRSWIGKYIYSPVMCQNLKKLVTNNLQPLMKNPDFAHTYEERFDKIKTLIDFDNNFTLRMFGFNTAFEYYRNASPVNRLLNIRIPTLIINALDDPIVGSVLLPRQEVMKNPYTLLLTTDYGGHLGWFNVKGERWYSEPLIRFFEGIHKIAKLDNSGKVVVKDEGVLPKKNKMVDGKLKTTELSFQI